MKNFDLEYNLMLFREAQSELFDANNERYTNTPISDSTAELILELINKFEKEIEELELKSDKWDKLGEAIDKHYKEDSERDL